LVNIVMNCDRGGRMSGDERREQIIRTAVEVFSKHGFSGTTTKRIAEAAGISEAMVFRHFTSKDDLYEAILLDKVCEGGDKQFPWMGDPLLEEAMARGDDHEVFYQLAVRALNKHQADSGFMRLIFYAALEDHDMSEQFVKNFMHQIYAFIGGYIEQRQKAGAMRNVNPRVVVRAFMGMLIHHSLNNILWDKKRTLLDITNEEAARTFADVLLNGVLTASGSDNEKTVSEK
jgi:AcrR family transcriptional regulator